MIDTIKVIVDINAPRIVKRRSNEPFFRKGLLFVPHYNQTLGTITGYSSKIENLKLFMTDESLYITNSIHKYWKENNYTDYTLTDIVKTICKLEDKLGFPIQNNKITRIAYGCVIREDPYLNFPNWKYFKEKLPEYMVSKGKRYGSKFNFTDYSFKGYDKAFELKMS